MTRALDSPTQREYLLRMTLIDTITVPDTSAEERAQRLTDAGSAWGQRIAADVTAANLTYKVNSVGEGAVASRITVGRHEFFVDEPASQLTVDSQGFGLPPAAVDRRLPPLRAGARHPDR